MLAIDDVTGKRTLDIKGQFLPLTRWRPNSVVICNGILKYEAVDKDYQYHLDHVFMMTGLSSRVLV